MAEQFLNRLTAIEKNIVALDETLKRMVSLLTAITEIRAEVRLAKQEILAALKSRPATEGDAKATEELVSLMVSEMQAIKDQIVTALSDVTSSKAPKTETGDMKVIMSKIDQLAKSLTESMDSFKSDMLGSIQTMARPAAVVEAPVSQVSIPTSTITTEQMVDESAATSGMRSTSLPPDKAMKIAEHLEKIIQALKMGCIAGEVIDTMTASKTEIMKIVPSDQILVKLDKWVGSLGSYQKRHEIQAKDIMRLKKEIRDEIFRYAPA